MRSDQSICFARPVPVVDFRTSIHRRRVIASVVVACSLATFAIATIDRASAQSRDPQALIDLAKRALAQNGGEVALEPATAPVLTPPLVTPPGWKLLGTVTNVYVGSPTELERRPCSMTPRLLIQPLRSTR